MRIDKYLWCVRYYKTRSIATDACKNGKIRVNGSIIKPSREVYPGDTITLRKDQINYSLEVLDLPESRVGAKLVDIYRKNTTDIEEINRLELLKTSKEYYRKRGMGRPTKKDRRDLGDYIDSDDS